MHVVILDVISLWDSEGLMMNLTTMRKGMDDKNEYLTIALKGKVKGESHERDHIFPCIPVTLNGINIKMWIQLLILAQHSTSRDGGPGMLNMDSTIIKIEELATFLHNFLIWLWEDKIKFLEEIQFKKDIIEKYLVFRSLRWASDTQVIEVNVSTNDIDVVNR